MAPDGGFPSPAPEARRESVRETARLALVIGALGVVFGDIGTSPIYTLHTVFNPSAPHSIAVSMQNVYGVVSLVFWSVVIRRPRRSPSSCPAASSTASSCG
ncbi:KUP/HAK/KT family potassium transporter [Streptomyces sp. NPDC001393]